LRKIFIREASNAREDRLRLGGSGMQGYKDDDEGYLVVTYNGGRPEDREDVVFSTADSDAIKGPRHVLEGDLTLWFNQADNMLINNGFIRTGAWKKLGSRWVADVQIIQSVLVVS